MWNVGQNLDEGTIASGTMSFGSLVPAQLLGFIRRKPHAVQPERTVLGGRPFRLENAASD